MNRYTINFVPEERVKYPISYIRTGQSNTRLNSQPDSQPGPGIEVPDVAMDFGIVPQVEIDVEQRPPAEPVDEVQARIREWLGLAIQ